MSKDKKITLKKRIMDRTAPFFTKIGGLSRKQRLLICVATLAVVGAVYYYFFLAPLIQRVASLNKNLTSLKADLVKYKRGAASLPAIKEKYKAAEDAFNMAVTALPDKKEIPSLLTAIANSGNNAGLEFVLFKPEAESLKDFYVEIPISIKVAGGYHQLAQFFDRVSRLSRIVNIKDIVINYSKNNASLAASCKALTYMFIEKREVEKPDAKKKKRRGKKG